MVSKKVLQKIGVFAMAAMVASAPVLAASAAEAGPVSLKYDYDTEDEGSSEVDTSEVVTSSGQTLHSIMGGKFTATVVEGVAITTPKAAYAEAFGANASDVSVLVTNSNHGPMAEASLNHGMAQLESDNVAATKGPVIDLLAFVRTEKIVDIANPVNVAMGIPASFQEAGVDYAVIRVQEGGRVSVLPDLDSDPSTLTFATDGFGVFAMIKAPAGSFDMYR